MLGLRALLALRDVELDALVFVQAAVAVGLDRGEVDEDVLAPAIDADEPETLVRVEPLDCSLRHAHISLPTMSPRTAREPAVNPRARRETRTQKLRPPACNHARGQTIPIRAAPGEARAQPHSQPTATFPRRCRPIRWANCVVVISSRMAPGDGGHREPTLGDAGADASGATTAVPFETELNDTVSGGPARLLVPACVLSAITWPRAG